MPKNKITHLPLPQVMNSKRLFYSKYFSEVYHKDAGNEIIHIIDGTMRLKFQSGKEYVAGRHDTLFIPYGVMHKDIFEINKGLEIFHMTFKWKLADHFFAEAEPDCMKALSHLDRNEVRLIFDMLRLDNDPQDRMLTELRLGHLLGIVWRSVFKSDAADSGKSDSFSRIVTYAKDYMKANLSENINIDSVAERLRVSRSTLIRAFRNYSEWSFNEYLLQLRMQQAIVLLRERALNLTDCAEQCGFSTPAYFSRVFKKYYGFSPKNIK